MISDVIVHTSCRNRSSAGASGNASAAADGANKDSRKRQANDVPGEFMFAEAVFAEIIDFTWSCVSTSAREVEA